MRKHTLSYTLHKVTQTTACMTHEHTNTHIHKPNQGQLPNCVHTHMHTLTAQITQMPAELNALSNLNALTHKYTQLRSWSHCETARLDTNTQPLSHVYTQVRLHMRTHTNSWLTCKYIWRLTLLRHKHLRITSDPTATLSVCLYYIISISLAWHLKYICVTKTYR